MNLQKMMKQAQEMQQRITDMQARLDAQEIDGAAGSGMVTVKVSGKNQLLAINIDKSLLKPEEKEMLEDLIIAAFRDARDKIDAAVSEQMGQVTAGMQLPPGMKLPF